MVSDRSLSDFIASNPDARELKLGVVYRSSQRYYALLSQAGYRRKKTHARSPQADPRQGIARRAEIKKN